MDTLRLNFVLLIGFTFFLFIQRDDKKDKNWLIEVKPERRNRRLLSYPHAFATYKAYESAYISRASFVKLSVKLSTETTCREEENKFC